METTVFAHYKRQFFETLAKTVIASGGLQSLIVVSEDLSPLKGGKALTVSVAKIFKKDPSKKIKLPDRASELGLDSLQRHLGPSKEGKCRGVYCRTHGAIKPEIRYPTGYRRTTHRRRVVVFEGVTRMWGNGEMACAGHMGVCHVANGWVPIWTLGGYFLYMLLLFKGNPHPSWQRQEV